jgi:DNA-binding beta-propeller fold protein YncE
MKYCIAALLALSSVVVGQEPPALSLTTHIPLPNVKGRIDHASVDLKGQRLFVAAVANNTLEVIDLKSSQRAQTITDLEEPQGVYYDASTNRLFVACGGNGVTTVYGGTTFKLIASYKFPDDADNIRYDARSKQVIVGYAGAKQLRKREAGTGGLGFLDTNGKLIREIVIDAHPESFRLEEKGTRISVNVPDKQEIEPEAPLCSLAATSDTFAIPKWATTPRAV